MACAGRNTRGVECITGVFWWLWPAAVLNTTNSTKHWIQRNNGKCFFPLLFLPHSLYCSAACHEVCKWKIRAFHCLRYLYPWLCCRRTMVQVEDEERASFEADKKKEGDFNTVFRQVCNYERQKHLYASRLRSSSSATADTANMEISYPKLPYRLLINHMPMHEEGRGEKRYPQAEICPI